MSRDCNNAQVDGTGRLIGPCDADVFESEDVRQTSPPEMIDQRVEAVSESIGMFQSHAIYERNAPSPADTTPISHESNNPWNPQISKAREQLRAAQNQRRSATMADDDYDNLYKRHFDLQGRRGNVIDTRFDLIGQRSALQDHISSFQQAQEELLVQVKSLSTADAALQISLSSAISSIQRSQDSLSQELGQTQELEKRLNKLEYEFGKEENEFFGDLRAALPSIIKTAQAPATPDPPAANFSPSGELDDMRKTMLQAFYDKSSDVPILEERLAELEHTFDFERGQRETRANLGQPILPPDLEFYTQYHQDKELLQGELAQIKSEVNRLQAECVQLGLIPPPPAPPSFNDDITVTSEQRPQKARSWMHYSESGKHLEHSFFSDGHQMPKLDMPALPNFANPRDRINRWIAESRDTAEPPEAPGSDNTSNGQLPQSGSNSGANNDPSSDAVSPRPASLRSWEDVDESQIRPKRTMSQSSGVLEPSHSDQQPPQESSKPC